MNSRNRSRERTAARPFTPQKIGLTVATALAAVNILGMGAFATWTDSASDQVDVQSGTLGIELAVDGAENRLYVDAANIAPGDTIQRVVTLRNNESIDLSSIELTTSAVNGSLLYTGGDRLDMKIARCSVPWSETELPAPDGDQTSVAYTYSCGGTTDYVLGTGGAYSDVQQSSTALDLNSLEAGGAADHLMVEMQLPQAADNNYQGLSETVNFEFLATQRSGEFR